MRRDVPLGVVAAQVAHAAGESFHFAASDVPRPTAVILGSRNEQRLLWLERRLIAAGVPHVAVREPDAPWNGQLMAIGLRPGPRGLLNPHVKEFNMLRDLS